MSLLMWFAAIIVVYIVSFKEDFTEEYINKAAPAVMLFALIALVIGGIGSLGAAS